MSKIPAVLRTLLGLAFVVFGLNYFHPFLPAPAMAPEVMKEVMALMVPFVGAKYMGLVKAIEIIAGLLLISNMFVPLALTLLAPILVGITVFHISLEPSGLPLPLVLVVLEIACAYFYRDAFRPMLQAKTSPHTATPAKATPADRGTVAA